MILGIQLLGVAFALLMGYIVFLHKKRGELTVREYAFWVTFWILFIVFILAHNSIDFFVIDVLDFSRTFDFFIVSGFMFLIGAVFYIYLQIRKTQKKIDTIVRKVAIQNVKKK